MFVLISFLYHNCFVFTIKEEKSYEKICCMYWKRRNCAANVFDFVILALKVIAMGICVRWVWASLVGLGQRDMGV